MITEKVYQHACRVAGWILKNHRQELTPAEEQELEAWLEEEPRHRETARELSNIPSLLQGLRFLDATDEQRGWEKTLCEIDVTRARRRRRARRARWSGVAIIVAAAIALLLARGREAPVAGLSLLPTPERRGVQLQLSDGMLLALDGITAVQESTGAEVARNDTATGLTYHAPTGQGDGTHVIVAPRGTEYRLTLSDGTAVWLNSESRLAYPVAFPGGARVVELSGEGYFEVAPGTPFIVKSGEIEVEVTGTAFNLEAYPGEEIARATLVSGSVEARVPGAAAVRLSPGQQARYTRSSRRLESVAVDTRPFVAWQRGEICFDHERLDDILKRLERWYDVAFVHDTPATRALVFHGTIRRHEHLSRVLAMLELTNLVRFTLVNEKTIQVNSR
jgi:ferric-dicitrate binding protein FerR (iron transport regulator)